MKYYGIVYFVVTILIISQTYSVKQLLHRSKVRSSNEKADSFDKLKVQIIENDSDTRKKQKTMYNDLLKFMLDNGAVIRKFSEKFVTDSNRFIYALDDIKKNEIIARIPEKLIIYVGNPEIQAFKMKLKNIEKKLERQYAMPFILWILENTKNPSKSFFKKYFDLLPKDMTNFPVLFKNKEEKTYYGSSKLLKASLDAKISTFKKDYDILVSNKYIPDNVTFNDFAQASLHYSSRDFGIKYNGNNENALIPLIDLFNYDKHPNIVNWDYDEQNKEFVIWADADIKKGEEIFLWYGDRTNVQCLEIYGFTTEKLPNADVSLTKDNISVILSKEMKKNNYEEALKPIYEKFVKEGSTSRTQTKLQSLNFLKALIEDYTAGYNTTLEKDVERLKTEKSFVMKNILRVLINEKKIFNFYLSAIKSDLVNLNNSDSGDQSQAPSKIPEIKSNAKKTPNKSTKQPSIKKATAKKL